MLLESAGNTSFLPPSFVLIVLCAAGDRRSPLSMWRWHQRAALVICSSTTMY